MGLVPHVLGLQRRRLDRPTEPCATLTTGRVGSLAPVLRPAGPQAAAPTPNPEMVAAWETHPSEAHYP